MDQVLCTRMFNAWRGLLKYMYQLCLNTRQKTDKVKLNSSKAYGRENNLYKTSKLSRTLTFALMFGLVFTILELQNTSNSSRTLTVATYFYKLTQQQNRKPVKSCLATSPSFTPKLQGFRCLFVGTTSSLSRSLD